MSVAAPASRPRVRSRRSQRYRIDTPRPDDDAAISQLLRLPMDGRVRLSLRREPNRRLAAAIEGDRHHEVVVRQRSDGQVIAYGHRSVRRLWIDGRPQRVGYLGGLRLLPGVRLPRGLIAEAFAAMLATRRPDEAGFDITSIMSDNHAARRGLERGVPGLPTYTPLGEMMTMTFRVRRQSRGGYVSSVAEARAQLQRRFDPAFQGRPCWVDCDDPPLLREEHHVAIGDPDAPLAVAGGLGSA